MILNQINKLLVAAVLRGYCVRAERASDAARKEVRELSI